MARSGDSALLKCSFCGKSHNQVLKLIAGPGVYICDECIDLCDEIIAEEMAEGAGEEAAAAAPVCTMTWTSCEGSSWSPVRLRSPGVCSLK